MGLESLIERIGENWTLAAAGLTIGLAFGFLAQRSRFCLRSAVIEFSRNVTGGKLTVWLFAFATAVLATQWLVLAGAFDARDARQIAARGSLSGAAVGGALFGMGMILARGCSSRLLVLAAQGNLRSVHLGAGVRRLRPGGVDRRAVAAAGGDLGVVDGRRRRLARPRRAHRHRPRRCHAVRRGVAGGGHLLGPPTAGAGVGMGRRHRCRPHDRRGLVGHLRHRPGLLRPAPDPGAELHRAVVRSADARALRHRQAAHLRPRPGSRRLPGFVHRRGAVPRAQAGRVSAAGPACAATCSAPWPWASAACSPAVAPWCRACRVRRCSRSPPGSRCARCGPRPR